MSGDRLAQIERYAKQPDIVGVLPQTHRMLPVADVLALVEIAKAARSAWDADRRSAGAWTATGEQAVRDLAAALDEIGSALARLDSER